MTIRRLFSQERLIQPVEMWKVLAGVVILLFSLVSASCPKHCRCPPEVPRCAAGVSLIPDHCGCCNVCAQQLFEDCSKKQPCDHTKGLECNFGGGFAAKGVCRATSDGRTCEYNNKIYQNGEIFRPNCKHQCTCMDGAVGCVSLCPRQLSLPKMNCAKPERVKVRRQCCEQLICAEKREPESSVVKKHRKHRGSQDDLSKKSNLVLLWRERAKSLPAFGSHPVGHTIARGVTCVSLTSAWSPCSKSCGTGMSKRMSNNNSKCKLVAETRMCEVRPCDQRAFSSLKKGKKVFPSKKVSHPLKPLRSDRRTLKEVHRESCSDG